MVSIRFAALALLPVVLAGGGGPLARPSSAGDLAQTARAQTPSAPPAPAPSHASEELDCRKCHLSKHQGVVQMYGGAGGRGAPRIPSHMFQVRVECTACHTTPKATDGSASIVGQTFRPSEQACVTCHGEKYRGLLQRWSTTLARMHETVAPKLAAAQAALGNAAGKDGKQARARKLVADADFNLRFVALGKGIHNVFYAADLLKLSNLWLDESMTLLGKAPMKADDRLVRGGYCAVLCHEAAGVKAKETVTFAGTKVPHGKHVAEFGATCTSCHSSEAHKAVTATRATCTACHHGAQNDHCESCHRAQSAFYRGETKTALATVEPNLMANTVPCTGCHDFSSKPSRAAIARTCVGCHAPPYLALMNEWTVGVDGDLRTARAAVRRAEEAVGRARRSSRKTAEADALLAEAREALALVRRAGAGHNPLAADALLATARQRAEAAEAAIETR